MCRVARIERFLDVWPDAEFGPGHIVLSDANLDDGCIDSCLEALSAMLDGTAWPEHFGSAQWWSHHDPAELSATRAFLRQLRALHEDERVEPGDVLCETDYGASRSWLTE